MIGSTTLSGGRGRWPRLVFGVAIVLAMLAAFTPTASARWIRGFSDINTAGDDISVCADEITIKAELDHLVASFESFYPTFDPVVGAPYPGGGNPQLIPLYGSAADAISSTNPVIEFSIPISFVGLSTSSYQFEGQTTLPTPAGYGDGDVLYARAFDENTLETIGVPLTIGDPAYGCSTVGEPESILLDVWTLWDLVLVDAPHPTILVFDAREADLGSVTFAVDDGPATAVTFVGFDLGHRDRVGRPRCGRARLRLLVGHPDHGQVRRHAADRRDPHHPGGPQLLVTARPLAAPSR